MIINQEHAQTTTTKKPDIVKEILGLIAEYEEEVRKLEEKKRKIRPEMDRSTKIIRQFDISKFITL